MACIMREAVGYSVISGTDSSTRRICQRQLPASRGPAAATVPDDQ